MTPRGKARHLVTFSMGACCFALDTWTKSLARQYLSLNISQPFIPHLIKLTLVLNSGAAFGLGKQNGFLVAILATLVFCWLFLWYLKRFQDSENRDDSAPSLIEQLSFGIILGAALGNLFDRCLHGKVTDFLEFEFISFPVFNLADVLIDLGIALMVFSIWPRQNKKKEK